MRATPALDKLDGLGPEVWRVLDKCHYLRNVAEYEGALDVDARIVADLVAACETVADKLQGRPGSPEGPR